MVTFDVNWFAVVIGALANIIIGAAWYSKSLFGETWAKEMGFSPKKMKDMGKNMGRSYGIMAVAALVTSFVMSNVVDLAGAVEIIDALIVGFWIWLGFVLTILIGGTLWEGKSQKLLTINASYWFVSLLVMAAIHVIF